MSAPAGKACFVRQWDILPHADASSFAAAYVALGFTWAIIPIAWGDGRTPNRDTAYWLQLRGRGVICAAMWGLPRPGDWRTQVEPFVAAAAALGAAGVVVDPEVEWLGHDNEAAEFARALRAACDRHGLWLAMTSYSVPQGHPTFPWAAWAAVVAFGIAQTYDRDMDFDPAYFARAMRGWADKGFREVIPAASLYDHRDDRAKTPAELERHLPQVPKVGSAALWPTLPIGRAIGPVLARWRVDPLDSGRTGGRTSRHRPTAKRRPRRRRTPARPAALASRS